jgi:isopentenyl diphosphate isomerase/L-lactate dehydrogenase-like FMN-dependent dehydrogenase
MSHPVSLEDYRRRAKRRLPKFVFDFVDGAAGDETTMRANREAFERRSIFPNYMVDASDRSQRTTLFGQEIETPVILAPTGLQRIVRAQGDLMAARGAGRAGTIYTASSASAFTVEEIAAAASGPLWFQLYLWRNREVVEGVVKRARAAGFTALMVTVDVPLVGLRERDLRNGMSIPPRITPRNVYEGARHPRWAWDLVTGPEITFKNFKGAVPESKGMALMSYANAELTNPGSVWDDLTWLRAIWPGTIIVKGILTAQDALRAKAAGADGVVVSNHGGRQLDGVPATLDVLPDVVAALPTDYPVLLDGGVRRGIDVVKALALGAAAVMIGRPYWYGLAVAGEDGVADMLEILKREIDFAMALSGRRTVADLSPDLLQPR